MLHDHEYENRLFVAAKKDFVNNGKFCFAGNLLVRAYEKYANNEALIDSERSLTYKELYFRSLLFAQKLADLGIGPGDHVVILFENSPEFFICYMAVWLRGGIVIPLNTFLHPKEVGYILNEAMPKIIIVSKTFKGLLEKTVEQGFLSQLPAMLSGDDVDFESPVPKRIDDRSAQVDFSQLDAKKTCLILFYGNILGQIHMPV